jgi:hypothetical protein
MTSAEKKLVGVDEKQLREQLHTEPIREAIKRLVAT